MCIAKRWIQKIEIQFPVDVYLYQNRLYDMD